MRRSSNDSCQQKSLGTEGARTENAAWISSSGWPLHWLALVVLCSMAYANVLSGEFVFDDANAVVENGTIRDISNLQLILDAPPRGGSTTDARPLVNLSLACNFALHGLRPKGYHLFNLGVHLANCGLALLLMRQLFQAPAAPGYLRQHSQAWALAATLLWCIHPVHSSVVSYVSQRAESMASFFYLLVLLMDLTIRKPSPWRNLACIPLVLGGLCKETIVTVVLVSIALQRWQEQQTWSEWWQVGRRELAFRFLAVLPVLCLAVMHGGRSGTAVQGDCDAVSFWEYLVSQGFVIPRYLFSIVNPFAVCADYGMYPPASLSACGLGMLVIVGLLLGSLWSAVSNRSFGLPLCCAAVFLAPSSSVIPIVTQIGGEHRIYLPSLAIGIYFVSGIAWIAMHSRIFTHALRIGASLSLIGASAGLLFFATRSVNNSYTSTTRFWERIVHQAPYNLRARQNLAASELGGGRAKEAFDWFEPLLTDARQGVVANLEAADLAEQAQDIDRANVYLKEIFRRQPEHAAATVIQARCALAAGQPLAAIESCRLVLEKQPTQAAAWHVLGRSYRKLTESFELPADELKLRQIDEQAEQAFCRALDVIPWSGDTRYSLAGLYLDQHRDAEAEIQLRQCLIYQPTRAEAWYWLAFLDFQQGNKPRARSEVAMSLELRVTPESELLELQIAGSANAAGNRRTTQNRSE